MVRSGNYGIYKGNEYHVTREDGNKKLEIYTHNNSKIDKDFVQCNRQGERECYKKYVWAFELNDIYQVDTYVVGKENKEMLVLKESEDQYLISAGYSNMDLVEYYQLKEVDRGIFHGWVNKKDVQLIEKRKPVRYLN